MCPSSKWRSCMGPLHCAWSLLMCPSSKRRSCMGLPIFTWPRVPISRGKQKLLIGTLCPQPPRAPSPILFLNYDSHRQNIALHVFSFNWACFQIGVFKLQSWHKSDTFLHNIMLVLLTHVFKVFSGCWRKKRKENQSCTCFWWFYWFCLHLYQTRAKPGAALQTALSVIN